MTTIIKVQARLPLKVVSTCSLPAQLTPFETAAGTDHSCQQQNVRKRLDAWTHDSGAHRRRHVLHMVGRHLSRHVMTAVTTVGKALVSEYDVITNTNLT
jgi:hypothetical protein